MKSIRSLIIGAAIVVLAVALGASHAQADPPTSSVVSGEPIEHPLATPLASDADGAETTHEIEEIDGGIFHLDLWSSDTAEVNAAVQIGGDYFYWFVAGGVDLTVDGPLSKSRYEVGSGIGTRIPAYRFFVDLDLSAYALLDHDGAFLEAGMAKARLGAGWRFATHFALFAGASANLFVDADLSEYGYDTTVEYPTYVDRVEVIGREGPVRFSLWPGFYAGIEL